MRPGDLPALLRAGEVERCHTQRVNRRQDIASHTWGVLVVLDYLLPPGKSSSSIVMRAALYHDVPEAQTGDVPATAKWRWPALNEALAKAERDAMSAFRLDLTTLIPEEKWYLKLADLADLCFYAVREVRSGNVEAHLLFQNAYEAMRVVYAGGQAESKTSHVEALLATILTHYNEQTAI